MKLIVGLGNPGVEYERTRHNAGWMVLDALAHRHSRGAVPRSRFHAACLDAELPGRGGGEGGAEKGSPEKVLFMKPTTFMNRSGLSVGEAVRFFKLTPASDVIVLTDDTALPVGQIRVRASGGTGGHNGLADIDRALAGQDYTRIRIGVGAKPALLDLADWVLSRFTEAEQADLARSITLAADAAECCVKLGTVQAMNRFNRRVPEAKPPDPPPASPPPATPPPRPPPSGTSPKPPDPV